MSFCIFGRVDRGDGSALLIFAVVPMCYPLYTSLINKQHIFCSLSHSCVAVNLLVAIVLLVAD